MKCLVTGGGGFLGQTLVKKLRAKDHDVVVLGRHEYKSAKDAGATCVIGDVRDYETVSKACEGCEAVFHTASKAGIWGPDSEYESINIKGAENILKACQAQGVKKLIYTSTPSVIYHKDAKIENIQEDVDYPDVFDCAYARTKAKAEKMLLKASGDDILTVALRPHLIYGPGDTHLIPRVVSRAKAGKLPQVGDGTNKVDITYVENAADAHILAYEHIDTAQGKAYFISDGEPVVLWDWINNLLKMLGIAPITKKVPLGAARFAGACMEGVYHLFGIKQEPRLTRFTAQQLATSHYFNIDNARRDLQYHPQVSGEEGLKRLVEWIKSGAMDNLEIK